MQEIFNFTRESDSVTVYAVGACEQVKPFWLELEQECDCDFFHSWHWMSSWLEMVLDKTSVYCFIYRQNDVVCSICMVTLCKSQRKKGLIRTLQLQLNEYLEPGLDMIKAYNGLLCREGTEKKSWEMFIEAAKRFNRQWDEILLSSISVSDQGLIQDIDHRLGIDLHRMAYRWVKDLSDQHACENTLLSTCKKKSRKQLKQSLNAFAEQCHIQIVAAENVETAMSYFEEMKEIHTRRWQAAGEDGSFANPYWVDFHKRLISNSFEQGIILMIRISCDEANLGYLYGHHYREKVYMHQTGFTLMDENKFRPGYVSHFEAMRYCAALGAKSYDFLPDDERSYKKFFTERGEPVSWFHLKRRRPVFILEKAINGLQRMKKG